jgi:UDP-N-acetylmuramoylalanine--D-glutamate ligase
MPTLTQSISLKGKKVTVIGAARSGIAAANMTVALGGIAKISEFNSDEKIAGLKELNSKVSCEFGGHTRAFIEDSDYVVLSPGVRQEIQPVQWAKAKGIPVIGEIEFGSLFCRAPIVAITGSNGKTTVSTLIAEVLKKAGRPAYLCGNIGTPFTKFASSLTEKDTVVLEVSSFQLESTHRFRPHLGVLLNFSENHLDRHKDLEEYFEAKWRMFANQTPEDFAILNAENPRMTALAASLKAKVSFFNVPEKLKLNANPNYLAVLEAARVLGIPSSVCEEVFRDFKGVEHRMEWVRTLDGVDYINDSKSTTAEATRWALERTTKPVWMICGGRDKNIDFSVLKSLVKTKVKTILAIGEAKEKIQKTFGDTVPVELCSSLEDAVGRGRQKARAGECVVLSPMCASFDMFKNFEHRGQVFKQIVGQLT